MNIRPMLADDGTLRDLQDPNAAAELKLDGTRAWLIKKDEEKGIFGRPREGISTDYTDRLKEVREAIEGIPAGSFIMDVEIAYFDPKTGRSIFEGSQRRCSTQDKAKQREYEKTWPIQAMAFDLIQLDGKMLHNYAWETRKQILQDLLKESLQKGIAFLPHTIDKKQELYSKVTARGEEGVMVKRLGSRYEEGRRSRSWLKVKHWNTERCLVVGYTAGRGNRLGYFRSLILAQPGPDGRLRHVGTVGSGFDKDEIRKIYRMLTAAEVDDPRVDARTSTGKRVEHTPVYIDLEIEVRFQEISKRGVFRMPTVLKDEYGHNLIHYDSRRITAKPRPTNLKDMLKELGEK